MTAQQRALLLALAEKGPKATEEDFMPLRSGVTLSAMKVAVDEMCTEALNRKDERVAAALLTILSRCTVAPSAAPRRPPSQTAPTVADRTDATYSDVRDILFLLADRASHFSLGSAAIGGVARIMQGYGRTAMFEWSSENGQIADVLIAMIGNVQMASLAQPLRTTIINDIVCQWLIIDALPDEAGDVHPGHIPESLGAFRVHPTLLRAGVGSVASFFLSLIDDDRDPVNVARLLQRIPTALESATRDATARDMAAIESLHESVSGYFPVAFTPPAGCPVSADNLRGLLQYSLSSTVVFAPLSMPFACNKLHANSYNAKRDSLALISALLSRHALVTLEEFTVDIITGLRSEAVKLQGLIRQNPEADRLLRQVFRCVEDVSRWIGRHLVASGQSSSSSSANDVVVGLLHPILSAAVSTVRTDPRNVPVYASLIHSAAVGSPEMFTAVSEFVMPDLLLTSDIAAGRTDIVVPSSLVLAAGLAASAERISSFRWASGERQWPVPPRALKITLGSSTIEVPSLFAAFYALADHGLRQGRLPPEAQAVAFECLASLVPLATRHPTFFDAPQSSQFAGAPIEMITTTYDRLTQSAVCATSSAGTVALRCLRELRKVENSASFRRLVLTSLIRCERPLQRGADADVLEEITEILSTTTTAGEVSLWTDADETVLLMHFLHGLASASAADFQTFVKLLKKTLPTAGVHPPLTPNELASNNVVAAGSAELFARLFQALLRPLAPAPIAGPLFQCLWHCPWCATFNASGRAQLEASLLQSVGCGLKGPSAPSATASAVLLLVQPEADASLLVPQVISAVTQLLKPDSHTTDLLDVHAVLWFDALSCVANRSADPASDFARCAARLNAQERALVALPFSRGSYAAGSRDAFHQIVVSSFNELARDLSIGPGPSDIHVTLSFSSGLLDSSCLVSRRALWQQRLLTDVTNAVLSPVTTSPPVRQASLTMLARVCSCAPKSLLRTNSGSLIQLVQDGLTTADTPAAAAGAMSLLLVLSGADPEGTIDDLLGLQEPEAGSPKGTGMRVSLIIAAARLAPCLPSMPQRQGTLELLTALGRIVALRLADGSTPPGVLPLDDVSTLKHAVTKAVQAALDDPKRLVRAAAAMCRHHWMLISSA